MGFLFFFYIYFSWISEKSLQIQKSIKWKINFVGLYMSRSMQWTYDMVVDTVFWRVSRKVILWREGCRFERNRKMHRIRTGRWGAVNGPEGIFYEDADPRGLVIGRWGSCQWSQEGRRKPELYEDSNDSVVIFNIV